MGIPSSSSTPVTTSPFRCSIPRPKAAKSLDEVFNSVLKYPQEKAGKGSKRSLKKDYVPSVVTSDKWVQYYELKEKEKIDKEIEKEKNARKEWKQSN